MDQLPINFNITIITSDVDLFIKLLKEGGFESQSEAVQIEWDIFNKK